MKRISVILPALCAAALCFPRYAEAQSPEIFRQEGIASWYGPEFDGRPTASGEIFNSSFFTAAHPVLPFGTMLLITNQHNNKQVTVRVNDRGPFVSARIIDVSRAAAEQLDMLVTGTAPVLVESIERIVTPSVTAPAAPDPYWTVPPAQAVSPAPAAPPPVIYTPAPPPPEPIVTVTPSHTTGAPYSQGVPSPQGTPYSQGTPSPPAQAYAPAAAPVPTAPPAPVPGPAELTPAITPIPDKTYRLQVGSYKVARHAVASFEKLKNAGLNPAYERNGEFFRVVLAGIRGSEVQSVTEKIGSAGFREALIREER